MEVLVTGSPGMLGRALMDRLKKAGHHAFGVSLSGREGSRACDLADASAVEALFGASAPGLVIHTAANSDVDGCERDPGSAHRVNGLATRHLAGACGSRGIPLVYVSTDYVFSGLKSSAYMETDPTCPVNIYGMTKLEGESFTRQLAPVSAIVRTSWLFGAGNPKNFVNAIVQKLLKDRRAGVLDDQHDAPTYVADLAEALLRIGERLAGKKAASELYHVCNNGSATRLSMTREISGLLGLKDAKVERLDPSAVPGRLARRPPCAVMSPSKYEKSFGVKMRGWQEALAEFLKAPLTCVS